MVILQTIPALSCHAAEIVKLLKTVKLDMLFKKEQRNDLHLRLHCKAGSATPRSICMAPTVPLHPKAQKSQSPSRDSAIQSSRGDLTSRTLLGERAPHPVHPPRVSPAVGGHLRLATKAPAGMNLRGLHQSRCRKGRKAKNPL